MMHPVPTDVFINIIHELSMLHRRSLLSLLYVSQQTNILVTPFIYQEIDINCEKCYFIPPLNYLSRLLRATTQPKLKFASYTSKVIVRTESPGIFFPIIMAIISTLPSLRMLAIWGGLRDFHPSVLRALHPSAQLTHLSLSFVGCAQDLIDVLESQQNLQFLSLPRLRHYLPLSPGSLPRLRVLMYDAKYGMYYTLGQNVEHLHLEQDAYDWDLRTPILIQNPQLACQGVRSLCLRVNHFSNTLAQLGPYLIDLEYLKVFVQDVPTAADLQPFRSPKLQYLSLNCRYDLTVAQQFANDLFGTFAHLSVIDVSLNIFTLPDWRTVVYGGEYRARFTRQSAIPSRINDDDDKFGRSLRWTPWDTWWLDAEDAVRNALVESCESSLGCFEVMHVPEA